MLNMRTHTFHVVGSRVIMISPGMVGKTPSTQASGARQWMPLRYLARSEVNNIPCDVCAPVNRAFVADVAVLKLDHTSPYYEVVGEKDPSKGSD